MNLGTTSFPSAMGGFVSGTNDEQLDRFPPVDVFPDVSREACHSWMVPLQTPTTSIVRILVGFPFADFTYVKFISCWGFQSSLDTYV